VLAYNAREQYTYNILQPGKSIS